MRVVITGGGTGGHLFPALAVAEEIVARGGKVLLVGSGRKIEKLVATKTPYQVSYLPVEGVLGRSMGSKIRAMAKMFLATGKALKILKRFSPQVVLGVGGYASVPIMLAASLLKIKRAIHEQNAIPGRANLLLAKLAHRIFITFPESQAYFSGKRTVITGLPIRKELTCGQREHDGIGLLVTGGSQGAHRLNKLVAEIFPRLVEKVPAVRLFHQTGERDFNWVKEAYRPFLERVVVKPFFHDMGWAYAQADLVLARAGASTVAEVAILQKPAVFIPYPYAINDHQFYNAQVLVRREGAFVMRENELSEEKLLHTLSSLLADEERRQKMARNLSGVLPENATERIVKELEEFIAYA
ncbi:undecaprenyldiphospho-muramoylpentapeptide beta-N-acetylglucosaminyltransferase [Thermodesulfatator autotrophicus]|uniref:UDP-N-acetylglucosamine--N-acetylmuramyl-(pentapeptide) pyrophosphoryl-undecaprenol N-acetylglucosamine transferase n=1 Tax=Thermodesulfatator autotrophicus TaxID=1795632 RepID=A0A177E923_9BACT|nr:undecaprenyldiphospho-muramoylpentapeptide beta-N-acetylglucosaminyltransferase [Thermodesulfatator autotrophicus]OAG27991.1 hypothetical protein TH606_03925 [Thermodesulfatator autotrophicus]